MPYSAYHSLTIEQIMAKVEKAYDREGARLCLRAHDFAARVHADQKRKSGEPYIIHPEYVASILTEIMIDPPTIAAGFLHDTVEDCEGVTVEMIEADFGEEVARLVDGVTKLQRLNFADREEQQAESLRKMIRTAYYLLYYITFIMSFQPSFRCVELQFVELQLM